MYLKLHWPVTRLIDWVSNIFLFARKMNRYTQSPFIRTSAEFLGKFKTQALGSSNLRSTSKNLRTTRAQIFKAKNGKKRKPCQFSVNSVDLELWHLKLSLYMKCSAKITLFMQIYIQFKIFSFFFWKNLRTRQRSNLKTSAPVSV